MHKRQTLKWIGGDLTAIIYFSTVNYCHAFPMSLTSMAAGFFLSPDYLYIILTKMEANTFWPYTEVFLFWSEGLSVLGKHLCKMTKKKSFRYDGFICDKWKVHDWFFVWPKTWCLLHCFFICSYRSNFLPRSCLIFLFSKRPFFTPATNMCI